MTYERGRSMKAHDWVEDADTAPGWPRHKHRDALRPPAFPSAVGTPAWMELRVPPLERPTRGLWQRFFDRLFGGVASA